MEKKEYYKHILPHFQQPGQAYFITWILNVHWVIKVKETDENGKPVYLQDIMHSVKR